MAERLRRSESPVEGDFPQNLDPTPGTVNVLSALRARNSLRRLALQRLFVFISPNNGLANWIHELLDVRDQLHGCQIYSLFL
jgi:hypothetical protein